MANKKAKVVKTLPTSGQFIAIWKYEGHLWSETLAWRKNPTSGDLALFLYEHHADGWVIQSVHAWKNGNSDLNIQYILLEE